MPNSSRNLTAKVWAAAGIRFAAAVGLLMIVCGVSAAGDLANIASAVLTPSPNTDDDDHQEHKRSNCRSKSWFSSDDDCDCDDNDDNSFLYNVTAIGLTSPWWGPVVAMGDTYTHPGCFPRRPYQGRDGYLIIGEYQQDGTAAGRGWGGRIAAEYGSNFDNLEFPAGRLTIDTATRFGVNADWRALEERLSDRDDQLNVGKLDIIFRFAQCETGFMYTGLGMNWVDMDPGSDVGWNFTYGGEWFPVRPMVLSSSFDFGSVGETRVVRVRATVGAVFYGIETYTGYDHLTIGSTHVDSWIAGVRVWF